MGTSLSGREEDLLAHLPGVVLLPLSLGPTLCLAACLPAALRSGTPARLWLLRLPGCRPDELNHL